MEQLARDIKKLEKEIAGKREKFANAQNKIDKIKQGDWSLLNESLNPSQAEKTALGLDD